jgi:hypothetical protein
MFNQRSFSLTSILVLLGTVSCAIDRGSAQANPTLCATTTTASVAYECIVPPIDTATRFSLAGAPEGMVIQPQSGYLHWTPMNHQQGQYSVQIIRTTGSTVQRDTLPLTVAAGAAAAAGIYVSPNGKDSNNGASTTPLLTLQAAVDRATPGTTIYLRGGSYYNDEYGKPDFANRKKSSFARISRSGTASQQITIQPHGNEYAQLISDVNGIVFNNAQYWRIKGIEIAGTAQSLDRAQSLALWWEDGIAANKIRGRGIAMNGAFNIEILNCIVHDFSGAGISNNDGAYITAADNIIYNNAWWSTSGTHGFANSKPVTTDNNVVDKVKIAMQRNLVFGNQSSMISHVFSKGFVTLAIDEGNGLHMQNNQNTFVGQFLAEQNLMAYNGKAGLGLNTANGSIIRKNSFYANAQAVAGAGELSIQSSESQTITNNLFHARSDQRTIRDFQNRYAGVGPNYAVPSLDMASMPASIVPVSQVFTDPVGGDFSPHHSIPSNYGPDASVLAGFNAKIREYGLKVKAAPTAVTSSYIRGLRKEILSKWPAPVTGDGIPDDLVLEDPETGYCYAYADRNDYPNPPSTGTQCKKER